MLARDAASPDDYRAAWDAIETLWEATLDRARLLPVDTLHQQVDGEWSLVETQRHRYAVRDLAVLEAGACTGNIRRLLHPQPDPNLSRSAGLLTYDVAVPGGRYRFQ